MNVIDALPPTLGPDTTRSTGSGEAATPNFMDVAGKEFTQLRAVPLLPVAAPFSQVLYWHGSVRGFGSASLDPMRGGNERSLAFELKFSQSEF